MSKTIEFAIPNRDSASQINAELSRYLTLVSRDGSDLVPDGYNVRTRFSYLQPVDANRNNIVNNFLNETDSEWLFMNDNDVVPQGDILKMVEHGKPVMSGVVCIKKNKIPQPIIIKEQAEHANSYRQVALGEYQDEINEDGLLEVEGLGTGCILIKREVLEAMEPPWFKFEYNEYGGLSLGEDFHFSKKLRQADVPMYVDTNQLAEHYKKIGLMEVALAVADARESARASTWTSAEEIIQKCESLEQAKEKMHEIADALGEDKGDEDGDE